MMSIDICKCAHSKELHRMFGEYQSCDYGYDRLTATSRKPYQYMVCSCNEFVPDNLRWLEMKACQNT